MAAAERSALMPPPPVPRATDPGSASPGPAPAPPSPTGNEDEDEPEYDPDDDDDFVGEDLPQFPTTHELVLKDHTKVVSALALDPSGARVLSGSHDYDCKLWDFGGMDARCKPFKTWEPVGSYYVRVLLSTVS
jgi:WD40 repeat protein